MWSPRQGKAPCPCCLPSQDATVGTSDESGPFFFFWPHHTACGTLVPRPGIEPVPPAVEAWSLNHWTPREVPKVDLSIK